MNNRKTCRISPEIGQLCVKQLAHELKNRNLYLTFANYFSVAGINDLAEFFQKRSEEENNHHYWVKEFLDDANYQFEYPVVEKNDVTIKNMMDPFIAQIDREILTTNMIYAIYDQALNEKDYMTTSWLYDKLVKEQLEEESLALTCRDIMEQDADIFVKAEKLLELLG